MGSGQKEDRRKERDRRRRQDIRRRAGVGERDSEKSKEDYQDEKEEEERGGARGGRREESTEEMGTGARAEQDSYLPLSPPHLSSDPPARRLGYSDAEKSRPVFRTGLSQTGAKSILDFMFGFLSRRQ